MIHQYDSSIFQAALKLAHITPVLKRGSKIRKKTIDRLVSCLMFQIFLKDACINKCQITLEILSPTFSVVFDRDSVNNIVL